MSDSSFEVAVLVQDQSYQIGKDKVGELARAVLTGEGVEPPAEISIVFVDRPSMAELNRRFRGIAGATDVLSFGVDEDYQAIGEQLGDEPVILGDVVICTEVAAINASEHAGDRGHNGSLADEVALLVIHGVLHLLGMDHESDEEATAMEAKEAYYLGTAYRVIKESKGLMAV